MGVLGNYVLSALNDSVLPHMREPVEEMFNGAVQNKGLPTRQDFRDLRNRVDMLAYNSREVTRLLNEVRGAVKRCNESVAAANAALDGSATS